MRTGVAITELLAEQIGSLIGTALDLIIAKLEAYTGMTPS